MVAEAENKAPALRKYDPNHALKLCGLRELTPVQLEAFEKWWKLFATFWIDNYPKNDHLLWAVVFNKDSASGVKKLFEECMTRESYENGDDDDDDHMRDDDDNEDDDHKRDEEDNEDDDGDEIEDPRLFGKAAQENFFKEAWLATSKNSGMDYFDEPKALRDSKIKAI